MLVKYRHCKEDTLKEYTEYINNKTYVLYNTIVYYTATLFISLYLILYHQYRLAPV